MPGRVIAWLRGDQEEREDGDGNCGECDKPEYPVPTGVLYEDATNEQAADCNIGRISVLQAPGHQSGTRTISDASNAAKYGNCASLLLDFREYLDDKVKGRWNSKRSA
jgi:hypothetical protein